MMLASVTNRNVDNIRVEDIHLYSAEITANLVEEIHAKLNILK